MTMLRLSAVALAAVSLSAAAPLTPDPPPLVALWEMQEEPDLDWTGALAPGTTLRILSAAGPVSVRAAEGDQARVVGHRRHAGRGEEPMRLSLRREGDEVLVCAYFPDRQRCDAEGLRGSTDRRHRERAELVVELPRGVNLRATTGTGEVSVEGATGGVGVRTGNGAVRVGPGAAEVDVSTGNGRVEVERAQGPVRVATGSGRVRAATARGPVNVSTGNGGIDARMDDVAPGAAMSFRSGNGAVRLVVPQDLSARFEATTGNGEVKLDLPLRLSGGVRRGTVRGTLGGGGPLLSIRTGNGDVSLMAAGS